jgi:Tfp pilus assembly protein PilZ
VPTLPEPLAIRGKVQWVVEAEEAEGDREAGMGIGFVWDSEAERSRVETVVERLMVDQLGPVLFDKLVGHRKRRDE